MIGVQTDPRITGIIVADTLSHKEANAAYKLLTTTNCTVEELGHIVEWNDSEFVADEPARYN
jgi:hypothetical protein